MSFQSRERAEVFTLVPVTEREIVSPSARTLRFVVTAAVTTGVKRNVTTWVAPAPTRVNGLPDTTLKGGETRHAAQDDSSARVLDGEDLVRKASDAHTRETRDADLAHREIDLRDGACSCRTGALIAACIHRGD